MGGPEKQAELWVAWATPGDEPEVLWTRPLEEVLKDAEQERKQREWSFQRAPFPLYGLPPSWEGRRFLGGGSWSGWRSERVHSLSLVHGSLVEGEGPMLVTETAAAGAPAGGGVLRVVAEDLWNRNVRNVEDAVAALSHEPPQDRDLVTSPTPSRAKALIVVEGTTVVFDVLSRLGNWVGRATVEGFLVTIEGQDFPLQGLEVVRIKDLGPYIRGSREFELGET
jgi:hypothetical protein